MAKLSFSSKRLQINKANATMVIIIASAAFVTVFSVIAAKALWSQQGYQGKVIRLKEKARNQLKANIKASEELVTAYRTFVEQPRNLLGGSPLAAGDRDGDNARLVLDALPSKYDFPALTTSLEKILVERNFTINRITGTDDEITQAAVDPTATPSPIDMPFEINIEGNYGAIQDLIKVFGNSIRPFHINSLSLVGSDNKLELTMKAKSYYQQARNLDIQKQVVK